MRRKLSQVFRTSPLGLGHGKPCPYGLWKDRSVGAWHAVPQT